MVSLQEFVEYKCEQTEVQRAYTERIDTLHDRLEVQEQALVAAQADAKTDSDRLDALAQEQIEKGKKWAELNAVVFEELRQGLEQLRK